MSAAARDPGRGKTHDGLPNPVVTDCQLRGGVPNRSNTKKQKAIFIKYWAAVFMAAAVLRGVDL